MLNKLLNINTVILEVHPGAWITSSYMKKKILSRTSAFSLDHHSQYKRVHDLLGSSLKPIECWLPEKILHVWYTQMNEIFSSQSSCQCVAIIHIISPTLILLGCISYNTSDTHHCGASSSQDTPIWHNQLNPLIVVRLSMFKISRITPILSYWLTNLNK